MGYGTDEHCRIAKEKIKAACGTPDAEIFFIPGGTQTNMLVLDTILAPYEAVISAETGHIQGHEAGAVEFTGHKILTVPGYEGKIKATDLRTVFEKSPTPCGADFTKGIIKIYHKIEQ